MKKAIVVYNSKRGSTKQYAEWIAEEVGNLCFDGAEVLNESMKVTDGQGSAVDNKLCSCELISLDESKSVNLYEYDLVIYGGWIRGSGIVGFDKFGERLDDMLLQRTMVFGVGIANQTPENYMQVWSLNLGKIDPKNNNKATLYIFDGAYNPATITGLDKFLMGVCKKVMLSGSAVDTTGAAAMMKDRIENGVDLVKRENIKAIVKEAKKRLNAE